jgi:DNA repair protein RadC
MRRIVELAEPAGVISNPARLFDRIKRIHIDYTQENLLLFTLDVRKRLINHHLLFKGGRSFVCIDPATIFRRALLDNAEAIIVAHNHPSGCLQPSDEDTHFTDSLRKAGKLLSIDLLDSIIFNREEYHPCR